MIAELIGLPADEALTMRQQVADFFEREPGQRGTTEANEAARTALMMRLAELIAPRMNGEPTTGDDHLSVMLRSQAEGKPMSLGAILAAIYTLLVTGSEVVPLSVANTAYYLWQHPDQRAQLTRDPAQIPHAYAESLRFDQPTNLLGRFVKFS